MLGRSNAVKSDSEQSNSAPYRVETSSLTSAYGAKAVLKDEGTLALAFEPNARGPGQGTETFPETAR